MVFDPMQLAKETEKIVLDVMSRKYYRTSRPGRWYGGIASADCTGCNLRCVFCWSGAARDNPDGIGRFHSPEQIFSSLTACAKKFGYRQLRVSGNEPTIAKDHLLKLLELVDQTRYKFILETNGTLIGQDMDFARKLSPFKCVHVRVSIKGTNKEEFARLTGAIPEAFNLQLKALKNLLNAGVAAHAAVMLSFSPRENLDELTNQLRSIDPHLADNAEEEYVILYPHVVKRLIEAGITPRIAYEPNKVPKELI
jgi:uncharacterized Fe-S cluster-containing radical SAM superfamily protein